MKENLKAILNGFLKCMNAHATPLTNKAELLDLIKRLQPVSTQRDLVRFGPKGDGGYLVPDDLEEIEACFSPGVSDISGFELDCANKGMKVFLADRSVERPADEHQAFHFIKKYIGVTQNEDFTTLDKWVEDSNLESNSDLLLQMDIEGYEYEVLLSASNALMKRFRIIVIEFHMLEELFNKPFFKLASRTFDKLLETHECVHIHPNNYSGTVKHCGIEVPKLMEFTFYRKDRAGETSKKIKFPHSLDADNTDKVALHLPAVWYE
jgi:hypothetical protein